MLEDSKLSAEQLGLKNPSMAQEEPGTGDSIHSTVEQWGFQRHRLWMECQMHSLDCWCKRRMESKSKEKQDSTGPELRHSNQCQDSRSKDYHRSRHKVNHILEERDESWERLAAGQQSDEVEIGTRQQALGQRVSDDASSWHPQSPSEQHGWSCQGSLIHSV
jgi:hypothetical protein